MISFLDTSTQAREINNKYDQNDTANDANKYAFLQKELNPLFTPFMPIPAREKEREGIILTSKVNTTLTVIIDNFDDFYSSVQGHDTYSYPHSTNKYERRQARQRKRFALQSYTTGLTGLEMTKLRGENPIITRNNLTANDSMDIKSVLTLPEPTVRFARVNLQATNILDKANLNLHFLNYWQLLNRSTKVSKTTIMDLSKPYNHEADTFLKQIKHYSVNPDILSGNNGNNGNNGNSGNSGNYNKFLETVIPRTKFLFNLIKPYLIGKLSIYDILAYLEPFMIYQNDLTFMQYKEMNEYIEEKISDYRKKYAGKAREFGNIRGTQIVAVPTFIKILDENPSLRAKVLDVYGFTDTIMQMTNADFIKQILETDQGVFYNSAIALISANLMIADGSRDMMDINTYLNKEGEGKKTKKTTKATKKNDMAGDMAGDMAKEMAGVNSDQAYCNGLKVIAKRYIAIDELNEDNGKEIYFDKKYDTTAYDIAKADSNLPLSEQIQYYMGKLKKDKGIADEINARRDAESIIKGKRTVEDGEYAILETTDEESATLQYYVRKQEHWVLDDTIDTETFADNLKMFCNINEKCIAVKETCQAQNTGANEIKKQNLKLLFAEFETSLNVNKDILTNKIEEELNNADSRIEMLRNLRVNSRYKYERLKNDIANTLETVVERKISPYDGLLSEIMGQADMAKRYLDISRFVKAFTREANADKTESLYWFYCMKSNKPLVPTFIHKLSTVFLSGGDYAMALAQICAEQGTISDDGDKWIDKHSGMTIKTIELNADEEYNEEGFKVVTRAVIESDAGELVMQIEGESLAQAKAPGQGQAPGQAPATLARKFATPDANKIYNVVASMSDNMGINLEEQKEFIVRNVLKQLTNTSVMPPKAAYEKLVAMSAVKGKVIDSYENAYNSTLLYLTFAYYLIAIQTSMPPIKTKTTFPGCKKSFSGYPLDGTDNMHGVTYVACVAQKSKNVANLPWSAIANRNAAFIAKQIEATIAKFILPTEEVQNAIKEVKLYMAGNPDINIPDEHNVANWLNFLPPLKPLKIATTQDIGDVFKERLSASMRKGDPLQHDYISEMKSKMMIFSFNIIELIEKAVRGEQAILRSNTGEPFVENACCEVGDNNTIQYFIRKEPDIAILNNKVVRLSDIYADTKSISRAAFLFDPRNTKRQLREIDNKFSEDTIYRAFIVYCKFNSLVPLPENMKAICPTKPDNFDPTDSLAESIRKLKSNARNYNENTLQQLLSVINNRSKQSVAFVEKELTNSEKLNAIMAKMDEENNRPSNFRAAFMSVLENFEINALLEDTTQMRHLKNILAKLNEDMQAQIIEFIADAGTKVSGASLKNFKSCMETIMQFKETGDDLFLGKKEETGYKMLNFMKNAMRCLTKEFPRIIMNKIQFDAGVTVPKHWKLSQKHTGDVNEIIKSHYVPLTALYADDQIRLLMEKLVGATADINELAQNTLFYSPVELKDKKSIDKKSISIDKKSISADKEAAATYKYTAFDLDLSTLLFQFYFLSVLTDLEALQTDADILQIPFIKLQEESSSDEELMFMAKTTDVDILIGNQDELKEKIANVLVVFTNLICKDKSVIDYNYQSLMELVLRSKEKEKDEITDYLEKMTDEERDVEKLFKGNKLGRWSKGEQKGIHTYDAQTYDEERNDMEQMALREARVNKRSVVTDMNRDIFMLEAMTNEAEGESLDREDNAITYMGEDGEPEDYGMDGDENY